ncbi:MAG: tetratricopeptide repeat protein [Bacteroidota bacterium]
MKFILFILMICSVTLLANTQSSKEVCDNEHKEILRLYYSNLEIDAKKRLERCTFNDPLIADIMNVLNARILYENKQYQNSLSVLNSAQKGIEEAYFDLKNYKAKDERTKKIIYTYSTMIEYMAHSYFMLGDYGKSLKYYTVQMELMPPAKATTYEYAGFSAYYLNKHNKALEYFEKAYKLYDKVSKKHKCAYNISAIYSKMDQSQKSVLWFKTALGHYLEYCEQSYINKIYLDNDFQNMKSSQEFQVFMERGEGSPDPAK